MRGEGMSDIHVVFQGKCSNCPERSLAVHIQSNGRFANIWCTKKDMCDRLEEHFQKLKERKGVKE